MSNDQMSIIRLLLSSAHLCHPSNLCQLKEDEVRILVAVYILKELSLVAFTKHGPLGVTSIMQCMHGGHGYRTAAPTVLMLVTPRGPCHQTFAKEMKGIHIVSTFSSLN